MLGVKGGRQSGAVWVSKAQKQLRKELSLLRQNSCLRSPYAAKASSAKEAD